LISLWIVKITQIVPIFLDNTITH